MNITPILFYFLIIWFGTCLATYPIIIELRIKRLWLNLTVCFLALSITGAIAVTSLQINYSLNLDQVNELYLFFMAFAIELSVVVSFIVSMRSFFVPDNQRKLPQ